jgi:hypothetical protein
MNAEHEPEIDAFHSVGCVRDCGESADARGQRRAQRSGASLRV